MNVILAGLPNLPVSYTTIVAAVILLIGLLIGIKKGFLKSFLSLLVTLGAVAGTIFGTPYAVNFLSTQSFAASLSPGLITAICVIIAFLLSWLVLKIVAAIINKIFNRGGVIGGLNRFLGGLLHVGIAFLFILLITFVLSLFKGNSAIASVIANAQVDPVGKWLFDNNLIMTILDFLAAKLPYISTFVEKLTSLAAAVA